MNYTTDYTTYFLGLADQANQRMEDRFQAILKSILDQRLPSSRERAEMAVLLQKEQIALTKMKEQLDRSSLERYKVDTDMINDLAGSKAALAIARMEAQAKVTVAQYGVLEAAMEEKVNDERAVANAKSDAGSDLVGLKSQSGLIILSGLTPEQQATKAAQSLQSIWENQGARRYAAAKTDAERAAVVEGFKEQIPSVLAAQDSMNKGSTSLAGSVSSVVSQLQLPTPSKSSADFVNEAHAARTSYIKAKPDFKGLDVDLILSTMDKAKLLTGTSDANLWSGAESPTNLTEYGKYVAKAAYERRQMTDGYDANVSYEDWVKDPESIKDIKIASQFSPTQLRALYEGQMPADYRRYLDAQKKFDEHKASMTADSDPSKTYLQAFQEARNIYKQLYGDTRLRNGIEASQALGDRFKGLTDMERQEVLDHLPMNDKQKLTVKKLMEGGRISDSEFRKLSVPNVSPLSDSKAIEALRNIPGLLVNEDGSAHTKGEDAFIFSGGKAIPVEQATIVDVAKTLAAHTSNRSLQRDLLNTATTLEAMAKKDPSIINAATSMGVEQLGKLFYTNNASFNNVVPPPPDDLVNPVTVELPAGGYGAKPQMPKAIPEKKLQHQADREARRLELEAQRQQREASRIGTNSGAATPLPKTNPDLQFLDDSKQQINKQYTAIKSTAGDALTTAADNTSNETKLVEAVESTLKDFSPSEKKLLRQLATQTRGQTPDKIQPLVTKIINPISNPTKYKQAIAYLATTADDGINSAYNAKRNRDLRLLEG